MKKILCVIGQLGNGGTEKQLYLFLKHLDKNKYSAAIFVTSEKPGIWKSRIKDDLQIEIVSSGKSRGIAKLKGYRDFVKKYRPDVIFSWSFFTNTLSLFSFGIDFVGSLRNQFSIAHKECGLIYSPFALEPKRIIVNSHSILSELKNYYLNQNRFQVIFNIFDKSLVNKHALNMKKDDFLRSYGIKDDSLIVMGVGRNAPQKNFTFFTDVVAGAHVRNQRVHGVIIGSGGNAVRDYIAANKWNDFFTLIDELPYVSEYLYFADLFFLSSTQEGMPNVLIEAVNAGCVTLATDVGGVRDIYKFVSDDILDNILLTDFDREKAIDKLLNLLENKDLCNEVVYHTKLFLNELSPNTIMKKYYKALGLEK